MTRENFVKISQPLMERLQRPVGRVLRDAELEPDQVAMSSRRGARLECRSFETSFVSSSTRNRCVLTTGRSRGPWCAVQAALIENDVAVDDMVMTDVCPFTLGVETARGLVLV